MSNLSSEIPIVGELNRHRQAGASFLRQLLLFPGNGNAHDLDAVFRCSVSGQAAPTAANIQQTFTGLELQFPAYQLKLVQLGFFERLSLFPIATRIHHVRIQHAFKDLIANIIMVLTRLKCAILALRIFSSF